MPSQPTIQESDQSQQVTRMTLPGYAFQGWSWASSNAALAMMDQAVVSGTRFCTTIYIGRLCGLPDLGVYSMIFGFYLIGACVQEALVTTPYTIFASRNSAPDRHRLAGSVLVHSVTISVTFAILVALSGLLYALVNQERSISMALFALACVIPGLSLWEFSRRVSMAQLEFASALLLDACTCGLQLGCLGFLALATQPTVPGTIAALGACCMFTGCVWFYANRHRIHFDRVHITADWMAHWRIGRWVLAGQVLGAVHGQLPTLILVSLVGTSAAGVFAACQNIVLLSNPLILAIANLVGATASRSYAKRGFVELLRVVRNTSAGAAAGMGLLCVALYFLGGSLLVFLYGVDFTGYGHVVAGIAVAAPMWAVSCVVAIGLRTAERPESEFTANAVGLAVTFAASCLLLSKFGLMGVVVGLNLGSLTAMLFLLHAFYFRAARESSTI